MREVGLFERGGRRVRGADSEGKKRAGGKHRTGRLDWEGVQRFITREHKECSQVLKYLRGCNECKEDAAAHFDLQAHRRTITQTQRFTGTSYTCRNVTMRKCKENIAGFATLFVQTGSNLVQELWRYSLMKIRKPSKTVGFSYCFDSHKPGVSRAYIFHQKRGRIVVLCLDFVPYVISRCKRTKNTRNNLRFSNWFYFTIFHRFLLHICTCSFLMFLYLLKMMFLANLVYIQVFSVL